MSQPSSTSRILPRFTALLFALGVALGLAVPFASAQAEETPLAPASAASEQPATEQESTPDIPKPLKVMPSKIKPVQSATDELSKAAPETEKITETADIQQLETLSPRQNFSYPANFWDKAERQGIASFLGAESVPSASLSIHNIKLKATLTTAGNLSASDVPSENLYALRLKQLVALGNFEDALILYKMNEADPPTPLAAISGAEAMLGSGQTAVACLEQKALPQDLKKESAQFWSNLDIFCQALLGPAAGNDKDLRLANAAQIYLEAVKPGTPTDAATLDALDTASTLALAKSGQLATLIDTQGVVDSLSDKHLAILWHFLPPTRQSLTVWSEATKRGIAKPAALTEKLTALLATAETATDTNPYTPFLKEYLKEKEPLLTASLLDLSMDSPIKQNLLIPLYAAQEVSFPEDNKIASLRLLARGNQDWPTSLVRGALAIPESFESGNESGEKIAVLYLIHQIEDAKTTATAQSYPVLLAIKAGLIPEKDGNSAYENIFNLTAQGNYVMPNAELLSTLKKSVEKKRADQVLIKSLEILTTAPPEKLNPAALVQVFEALNSAGLSEETMSLARDVLGAVLEK